MEFFGIGPLELVAILIIIFIVMGPSDMVKMGNSIGRAIRNFRRSGIMQSFNQASRQLRELPDTLMREVGGDEIGELRDEIKGEVQEQKGQLDELNKQFVAWTRQPEPQSQKKQAPAEAQGEAPPDPEPPTPDTADSQED